MKRELYDLWWTLNKSILKQNKERGNFSNSNKNCYLEIFYLNLKGTQVPIYAKITEVVFKIKNNYIKLKYSIDIHKTENFQYISDISDDWFLRTLPEEGEFEKFYKSIQDYNRQSNYQSNLIFNIKNNKIWNLLLNESILDLI